MMKRLAKLLTVLATAAVIGGCADAPVKPTAAVSASTAGENPKLMKMMAVASTRLPNDLKVEQCPASPTAWHREDLSKLLGLANACAQFKKTERLEDLGNFMAQHFVIEPWGAFYLSVAAEQHKDYSRALWMIELAVKKSPHNGLLYYQRARIHWQLNEMGLAVDDYKTAVKENSRLADAQLVLAQYSTRANDLKSAEGYYQQFIAVEPENHIALAAYGEVEVALNHAKYAIELFQRAASASPRNIQYRMRLGFLYETSQKDYEQALSAYRSVKTLLSDSRAPADARSAEVSEKIKKLEALVTPEPKEAKVTRADQSAQAEVKK